jgi:hypothetical protein
MIHHRDYSGCLSVVGVEWLCDEERDAGSELGAIEFEVRLARFCDNPSNAIYGASAYCYLLAYAV